jgi:hypothetical protein
MKLGGVSDSLACPTRLSNTLYAALFRVYCNYHGSFSPTGNAGCGLASARHMSGHYDIEEAFVSLRFGGIYSMK